MALVKAARHPLRCQQAYDDKAFVSDVKIMIMASFGVRGDRRMDVIDRGAISEQRSRYPDNVLPYGWLARPAAAALLANDDLP